MQEGRTVINETDDCEAEKVWPLFNTCYCHVVLASR